MNETISLNTQFYLAVLWTKQKPFIVCLVVFIWPKQTHEIQFLVIWLPEQQPERVLQDAVGSPLAWLSGNKFHFCFPQP